MIEDVKPQILLRPNVSKKELENLRIYKMGYDLLVELHRYSESMPRIHRYTIGERIIHHYIIMKLLPNI